MEAMEPVAVIFADLAFAVDEYRSGHGWQPLGRWRSLASPTPPAAGRCFWALAYVDDLSGGQLNCWGSLDGALTGLAQCFFERVHRLSPLAQPCLGNERSRALVVELLAQCVKLGFGQGHRRGPHPLIQLAHWDGWARSTWLEARP